MRIHFSVLSLALTTGVAPAQEERRPEEVLSVKIICENWGDETPRPAAESGSESYYLVDHRIRWEVGPMPVGTVDSLTSQLKRIYDDKRTWLPDRQNPGERKPMPIVIEPGHPLCWHDVVLTCTAVTAARFREVRIHDSVRLVPERVAPEQVPAGILVPAAEDAEPLPPSSWRAELQITQRGALRQGDTTIYDPERDAGDRSAVVAFLKALRDQARQEGAVLHEEVDGKVREVLARPILLYADKWAEYYWIQRLLEDCRRVQPPFPILHAAVTRQDEEERRLRTR